MVEDRRPSRDYLEVLRPAPTPALGRVAPVFRTASRKNVP